ncbi:MAG: TniQ family protein [Myxacorys californica WJT36-NPBG1]|jgi:hypothetical protein|nr:TniQ family protein [Myxacorys californica WJT36-NPBG1]
MLIHELKSYDSWDLVLPATPERSKLYYLEPIAEGTPYIEGLVSYICRLAKAHCVSPAILIKQEILPSFRQNYSIGLGAVHEVREEGGLVSVSSFAKPVYKRNPNEYGLLAWQYLEGLKVLTLRENLQPLTIPDWMNKPFQAKQSKVELAREVRAWCPECFQAWRNAKQPIYEPLLWSIAAVTVCLHHGQPLQFCCPNCKKTQRPITGRMQVGQCSGCLGWLDVRPGQTSEAEHLIEAELDWHLWVAKQIAEVLSVTPTIPSLETRRAIAGVLSDKEKPYPIISPQSIQHPQWNLLETFAHWAH